MKNKKARKMLIHHLSEAHQQDFKFISREVTWNSWSKFFNCHIDQAAYFGAIYKEKKTTVLNELVKKEHDRLCEMLSL